MYYFYPDGHSCCEGSTTKCPDTQGCGECNPCEEFLPCVEYDGSGQLEYCSATLKKDSNGNPVLDGPPDQQECTYILDCGSSPVDYVLRSFLTISTGCTTCEFSYDQNEVYYVYTSFCDPTATWVDPESPWYFATYDDPIEMYWNQNECCFISTDSVHRYCPTNDQYSENDIVFVDPYADAWGTTSDSRITPDSAGGLWWEDVTSHRRVINDGTLGGERNVNINCA